MTAPLAGAPWLNRQESRKLLDVLTTDGAPARFVGGCVRDAMLGEFDPDGDLDIATALLPDEVIKRLEAADIKAIPTGLKHGTVTALVDGQTYEITTLRKDVACDGRHADVQFTDDFELDAKRRDFTINAMSTDWRGQLFDYFGGWEDLKAGRVRFVGDAQERVREDYLRILRFFRFYARYGRPPADRQALQACREGTDGLTHLSGERTRSEMFKLLASGGVVAALTLMIENSVLRHILPIDVDLISLNQLITLVPDSDPLLRLAALLRSNTATASMPAAVAAWRLSNAEAARLQRLTEGPLPDLPMSPGTAKRQVYREGPGIYTDLVNLSARTEDDLERSLPPPAVENFPITGQDLINHGVPPGPDLGQQLKQLEDWWLEQDMQPDRQELLQELVKRLKHPPATSQNP
ncbi:MAG: CCA tRNA nucleotidyltransferase [Pseudomonadota bacterium]